MSEPLDTDASLAADGRFDDALKRVSYQAGMLLGLEATRAEQDYHRRRLNRHGYWMHGAGTVVGLRVAARGDDPGNDTDTAKVRLLVEPGVGVDGLGRQVDVSEPWCIDLAAWLTTRKADADAWDALVRDGYRASDDSLWLKVTMRYQDCASGLQPVLGLGVNAGTDPVEPARNKDCVLFELLPERPGDDPEGEHPFASHRGLPDLDADLEKRLSKPEQDQIKNASGNGKRQLQLAARLLHALSDDSQALAGRQAYVSDAAELARVLLARVRIALAPNRALIVNPRRVEVDNLVRPFLFNAAILARLLRE